jgi:hypothetical protein
LALSSSSKLDQALDVTDWEIFDGIRALTDDRKQTAEQIWTDLQEAFNSDEYAVALLPKLSELRQKAVRLLTKVVPPTPPPPTPPQLPEPPPQPEPPARTVAKLKALYGGSQVQGDELPAWLSAEARLDVLRVHCFGKDPTDWKSLVVVTPLFETLIRLDEGAKINLSDKTLSLPGFGKELPLQVKPEHLQSE